MSDNRDRILTIEDRHGIAPGVIITIDGNAKLRDIVIESNRHRDGTSSVTTLEPSGKLWATIGPMDRKTLSNFIAAFPPICGLTHG